LSSRRTWAENCNSCPSVRFYFFLNGTEKGGKARTRKKSACSLASFYSLSLFLPFFVSIGKAVAALGWATRTGRRLSDKRGKKRKEAKRGRKEFPFSRHVVISLSLSRSLSKSHLYALREERQGDDGREGDSVEASHDVLRKNFTRQDTEERERDVLCHSIITYSIGQTCNSWHICKRFSFCHWHATAWEVITPISPTNALTSILQDPAPGSSTRTTVVQPGNRLPYQRVGFTSISMTIAPQPTPS